MSTEITVALVYEQEDGVTALRAALANAGVRIAAECRASMLDTAAILGSGADAIVVNLDSELADLLDEVTDALDASEKPVIFNDPSASSDLSGWDRARWMRHLSAKLKGNSDFTPPAPPGAQSIPMPVIRKVEVAPVAVVPLAKVATSGEHVAQEPVSENLGTISQSDLLEFEQPSSTATASTDEQPLVGSDLELDALLDISFEAAEQDSPQPIVDEFSMAGLDLEFNVSVAAPPALELSTTLELPLADLHAPKDSGTLIVGDELAELDALFAEPFAGVVDVGRVESAADASLDDLDSLFSAEPDDQLSAVTPVMADNELTDLDAMFRDFESAQSAPPVDSTLASTVAAAADSASEASSFKGMSEALSWSLEPVEEQKPANLRAESEMSFEWRLDGASAAKPIKPVAAPVVAVKPEKSGPVIPVELEQSLALADFKLQDFEDSIVEESPAVEISASSASVVDEFDRLDLSDIELELVEVEPSSPAHIEEAGLDLGFAELDFDLGLDVNGGVMMDSDDNSIAASDSDLDSLFITTPAPSSTGLNLPDLNRVFVLGASVGGPEAIKAFLGRIPANVAAAFVVAQHMGAEFLEIMAAQLDASTQLSVRFPKAGERLRHGEVVVAPASEQISVDQSGHLQFSAVSSTTPYSPSIDQLVREVTDRLGDQLTLILFSGMGNDAVEGGVYLSERGGQVWAQDRSSCVIASMIDAAKSRGIVKFEGSPVQLAERVLETLV